MAAISIGRHRDLLEVSTGPIDVGRAQVTRAIAVRFRENRMLAVGGGLNFPRRVHGRFLSRGIPPDLRVGRDQHHVMISHGDEALAQSLLSLNARFGEIRLPASRRKQWYQSLLNGADLAAELCRALHLRQSAATP